MRMIYSKHFVNALSIFIYMETLFTPCIFKINFFRSVHSKFVHFNHVTFQSID